MKRIDSISTAICGCGFSATILGEDFFDGLAPLGGISLLVDHLSLGHEQVADRLGVAGVKRFDERFDVAADDRFVLRGDDFGFAAVPGFDPEPRNGRQANERDEEQFRAIPIMDSPPRAKTTDVRKNRVAEIPATPTLNDHLSETRTRDMPAKDRTIRARCPKFSDSSAPIIRKHSLQPDSNRARFLMPSRHMTLRIAVASTASVISDATSGAREDR